VQIYSAATALDGTRTSTRRPTPAPTASPWRRSSKNLGLISGYQHITSIDAAHTAIQTGPFITGTNWLSGMDDPDS
jgi:hypothetical protein